MNSSRYSIFKLDILKIFLKYLFKLDSPEFAVLYKMFKDFR